VRFLRLINSADVELIAGLLYLNLKSEARGRIPHGSGPQAREGTATPFIYGRAADQRSMGQIEIEHLHRYLMVRELCCGKDVLDVACGQGYGAAMVAQVARSVTGWTFILERSHTPAVPIPGSICASWFRANHEIPRIAQKRPRALGCNGPQRGKRRNEQLQSHCGDCE
jgi:hypothetical protein